MKKLFRQVAAWVRLVFFLLSPVALFSGCASTSILPVKPETPGEGYYLSLAINSAARTLAAGAVRSHAISVKSGRGKIATTDDTRAALDLAYEATCSLRAKSVTVSTVQASGTIADVITSATAAIKATTIVRRASTTIQAAHATGTPLPFSAIEAMRRSDDAARADLVSALEAR